MAVVTRLASIGLHRFVRNNTLSIVNKCHVHYNFLIVFTSDVLRKRYNFSLKSRQEIASKKQYHC